MPRVLQVIVTDNFAGAERYVVNLSRSLAALGWEATVVGGRRDRMAELLGPDIRWLPGATPHAAVASVRSAGRFDVCHTHMTYAEAVGVVTGRSHAAPVVATRHFASRRGASLAGRATARWISRRLAAEIAISDFVANAIESPPTAVILNGVEERPLLWRAQNRTVLVMQRLEAEKQTEVALRGWAAAGLADHGWELKVVGHGSLLPDLKSLVERERIPGVRFIGWVPDVDAELAAAGMLLAPAPKEPLGLSVLEAMAAGVPVVAAAGGGHLETIGLLPEAPSFLPGDVEGSGRAIMQLAADEGLRTRLSAQAHSLQRRVFSLGGHARSVARLYRSL